MTAGRSLSLPGDCPSPAGRMVAAACLQEPCTQALTGQPPPVSPASPRSVSHPCSFFKLGNENELCFSRLLLPKLQ